MTTSGGRSHVPGLALVAGIGCVLLLVTSAGAQGPALPPELEKVRAAPILVTVLGLNLLGSALRDVLDPRLK